VLHLLSDSPSLSFPPKLGLEITSAPGFRQENDVMGDVCQTGAVGGYDHFDPRPAKRGHAREVNAIETSGQHHVSEDQSHIGRVLTEKNQCLFGR
jgi:hypothetical protein